LLTAAAETFILGCPLDPKKGEVAFTQPTGLGGKVLEKWARGKGRVYEE
jgi:N-acetyltransferase